MLLDGRRIDDDTGEVEVRAVVRGLPLSPRGPDGADGVVGVFPPTGERTAKNPELLLQGPHAHAQDHPPAAGPVEGAVALHHLQRVVVGQHHAEGGQAHPRGASGQEAEGDGGVPVATPPAGLGRLRDGHVLRAGEVVVTQAVGGLGYGHHVVDVTAVLPLVHHPRVEHQHRRDEPEAHPGDNTGGAEGGSMAELTEHEIDTMTTPAWERALRRTGEDFVLPRRTRAGTACQRRHEPSPSPGPWWRTSEAARWPRTKRRSW